MTYKIAIKVNHKFLVYKEEVSNLPILSVIENAFLELGIKENKMYDITRIYVSKEEDKW